MDVERATGLQPLAKPHTHLNTVRSQGLYKDLGLAHVSAKLIFNSGFILKLHHRKLRVAHSVFLAEAFDIH